jgi:DNA-binding GntR family transcriptional regulator
MDEGAIAREFHVSRTPIREAIVRLASEGLIVLLPNKGSQVAPLDLARIRDYLEAIDLIQRAVTALAARRRAEANLAEIASTAAAFEGAVAASDSETMVVRNHAFHAAVARACGNELLAASYLRLLDEGLRIARFTLGDRFYSSRASHRNFLDVVVQEHREMLEAIERGDEEAAERVAKQHTDHTRNRFSAFLGEGSSRNGSVLA